MEGIWCILVFLRLSVLAAPCCTVGIDLESSLGGRAACPGETVVFECQVKQAGRLTWRIAPPANNTILLDLSKHGSFTGQDISGLYSAIVTNYSRNPQVQFLGDISSNLSVVASPESVRDLKMITCSDGITTPIPSLLLILANYPSSPQNLTYIIISYGINNYRVRIQWKPPSSDDGVPIHSYSFAVNRVGKQSGSGNLTSNRSIILALQYNYNYIFEISAENCNGRGELAFLNITGGPPQPSLNANLMCNVGSVRADIQWQYGNSSAVYIPSTDSVTVNINPNTGTGCNDVTKETMNCSFDTTSKTTYTVVINATNLIGTNSTDMTFDSRPLLINDSGLNDGTAPHIIISVNSLCQDDEYTIYVQFGRRASDNSCVVQQNVTIMNGGKVNVPSDVTNGGGQYCYTAVLSNVAGNTTPTTPTDEDKKDEEIGIGPIFGWCLAGYGWYVSSVSNIAIHFYWFLPVIAAGLSGINILLYSFGFIFSVVVFPIALVLWILSCCKVFSEDSDDSSHTSYSSPHNSTITLILCCIGVVTSIIIFPFGITVLIFYSCGHKRTAKSLLKSFGIVGAVIVLPIGLVLLLASCFCETDTESCEQSETETSSPKELPKYSESRWTRTIVKIGTVGSVIVFPVGIVILTYHLYYGRTTKEKAAEGVKESVVVYDLPTAPVRDNKPERGTSINMAYGVLQGIPITDNPAYAQVRR